MSEVFCSFAIRTSQHQVTIAVGDAHPALERGAEMAGHCYRAGLEALRVGANFADVAETMLELVAAAGGWVRELQIHALNPGVAICHCPANNIHVTGLEQHPDVPEVPTMPAELTLKPGTTFIFEPSCGFGRHVVTVGGTVLVGEDGAIELNPKTAKLLRVGA